MTDTTPPDRDNAPLKPAEPARKPAVRKVRAGMSLIWLVPILALIVTLMTIAVRLAGIGGGADNRNRTIVRMQRLENCLSGYHAAFGSYPPVKLHGTRDIYQRVSSHGIQTDRRNESIWGWNEIGEQGEREESAAS